MSEPEPIKTPVCDWCGERIFVEHTYCERAKKWVRTAVKGGMAELELRLTDLLPDQQKAMPRPAPDGVLEEPPAIQAHLVTVRTTPPTLRAFVHLDEAQGYVRNSRQMGLDCTIEALTLHPQEPKAREQGEGRDWRTNEYLRTECNRLLAGIEELKGDRRKRDEEIGRLKERVKELEAQLAKAPKRCCEDGPDGLPKCDGSCASDPVVQAALGPREWPTEKEYAFYSDFLLALQGLAKASKAPCYSLCLEEIDIALCAYEHAMGVRLSETLPASAT